MFENSSDKILSEMARENEPITRKVYLQRNFPDGLPEPWTTEHERALPRLFRR
jgi:hypothetical protein